MSRWVKRRRAATSRGCQAASPLMRVMVAAALAAWLPLAQNARAGQAAPGEATPAYLKSVEKWRAQRNRSLAQSDGWLTVVGMEWLREGENRVGSAADNDIRLTGGPAHWGRVVVDADTLQFVNFGGEAITIDGVSRARSRLVADDAGEPTIVASGPLSFYVISRGSYALRIKDANAAGRLQFRGVPHYPVDPSWRIRARFEPAPRGETIEIANVLGQVDRQRVLGTVSFERAGKTFRLLAIEEGEGDMWIIFNDRTNGHGTYGAGRFLHSDGLPRDGYLTIDFNKAYNPPCAFTDYATCPLPPQRNRMDIAVTAGEKAYHAHAVR